MHTLTTGLVVMAAALMVVAVKETATTAHPIVCRSANETIEQMVKESDGCIQGKVDQNSMRLKRTHIVYCKAGCHCNYAFRDILSSNRGCNVSNEDFSANDDQLYFFFGSFLDDSYHHSFLTRKPLVYHKEKQKEIFNHYVSLTVLERPDVDVEGAWQEDRRNNPPVYYVKEGSSVELTCAYTHENAPCELKLKWNRNSGEVLLKHLIGAKIEHLINSSLEDSGIYSCQSTLGNKSSDPSKLEIIVVASNVNYLNTSISQPNVTKAVKGNEPVKWEVRFLAHPMPTFTWIKGGQVLRESKTNTSATQTRNHEMDIILKEGAVRLYLYHPTLAANGMYTLEASLPNSNITTTTTMFLAIPGKPQSVSIKSPDNKKILREGENFSLTCQAEGYPKPNLTLFSTPIEDLDYSEDYQNYKLLMEEEESANGDKASMVEHQVHWMGVAEKTGYYQCMAENDLGKDYSDPILFLVTDKEAPSITSFELEINGGGKHVVDEPFTVVDKGAFSITCRANKMSGEGLLTWTVNDENLDSTVQKAWGMKIIENDTLMPFVSTVWARTLHRTASKFTIACEDKACNQKSLTVHVKEMTSPVWRGEYPGGDYTVDKDDNLTLSCLADGIPPPKVTWKKGNQELVDDRGLKIEDDYQLFFDMLSSIHSGQYMCVVSNRVGNLSASFNVAVHDPDAEDTTLIFVLVGVLVVALVVLGIFFGCKIYQDRKETLNLQLREQRMFMEGDPLNLSPDISLEQQAELLPYNTKFEVSRKSIVLDKLLGSGAFGRVYRATVHNLVPGEASTTVAVKMMKSRTDCQQLKALRSEVKILIHIGRHINIVNLLGACSKDLSSKGELLLLVEYCKHGNILEHMRRFGQKFINQINDEGEIDPQHTATSGSNLRSPTSCSLKYTSLSFPQDMHGTNQAADGVAATSSSLDTYEISCNTIVSTLSGRSESDSHTLLCSVDLLGWAYQVAKGMEYLAFKKVLHGDLAARNVLLAENNVVKISDFGLAKDIYKKDYQKTGNGPMPVKWLAVECLREGVFSTQSDVWSFGVVMWEIFSLGQIPYSCSKLDESFIQKLEGGTRLEHPRYATYNLYRLMLECWNTDPMARPSFSALEDRLGKMLGEVQRQNYLHLGQQYQQDDSLNELLELFPSQDYSAKVCKTTPMLNEDDSMTPLIPSVMPQMGGRRELPEVSGQKEGHWREETNLSSSSYLTMLANCTDDRPVFDFDKDIVFFRGQGEKQENDSHSLYLCMNKIPLHSLPANTPDSISKGHDGSSPHILKSVLQQGSQHGDLQKEVTMSSPTLPPANYGGTESHNEAHEGSVDTGGNVEYVNILP